MRSDLQALPAAIASDPSDDVARLVYADCPEEHGNAARAAFVRLQVEAERHHPDSGARRAGIASAGAVQTVRSRWASRIGSSRSA
jgi:uncharacterized protein (TIGR02996 family)